MVRILSWLQHSLRSPGIHGNFSAFFCITVKYATSTELVLSTFIVSRVYELDLFAILYVSILPLRCSKSLINPDERVGEQLLQSDLIPLLSPGVETKPRLVIGHNVCYDRARTSEEYDIAQTRTR